MRRNPCESHENYENHRNTYENYEYHKRKQIHKRTTKIIKIL